jgi:glutaminase
MTEQPTALYLAEILQSEPGAVADAASAELRRLHAVNQELLEALKNYVDGCSLGVNAAEVARAVIAKAEGKV